MPVAVRIAARDAELEGDLAVPAGARGIVVFAHGSGSSRHSPRNREVAATLRSAGVGTLLMDLLTPEEDVVDRRTREHRFDITLLAGRVADATAWLQQRDDTAGLAVGCFGASTGAAAALVAAGERPETVRAVVSRGGRPDLAGDALERVQAPTLLIVGGEDHAVIGMNEEARDRLRCETRIEVVAGATHLFEEPGAMEQVSHLAGEWFMRHLSDPEAS